MQMHLIIDLLIQKESHNMRDRESQILYSTDFMCIFAPLPFFLHIIFSLPLCVSNLSLIRIPHSVTVFLPTHSMPLSDLSNFTHTLLSPLFPLLSLPLFFPKASSFVV